MPRSGIESERWDHLLDSLEGGMLNPSEDRRHVLIHSMEALGERGVVVNSLECLKQSFARETAKLAALTNAMDETLVGIHEKERHVARMDLND
nr:hypothetical protein [Tanacetum cinerariifolium]